MPGAVWQFIILPVVFKMVQRSMNYLLIGTFLWRIPRVTAD